MTLVGKANPEKQGIHSTTSGFEPTALKVYHGVGNDQTRPRQCLPGQFFSGDSHVLGEKFNAVPLAIFERNTLWPPQSDTGEGNKAPICNSVDRKTGSKYGSCDACPLNPKVRSYTQGGCTAEYAVYLMDETMTSIYDLRFSKSSGKTGRVLMDILKKQKFVWERWFTFEAVPQTKGSSKKYYIIGASPIADAVKAVTSVAFHPLFSAFSKLIDADVYYPQLAAVHDRLKGGEGATVDGTTAPAFDEKAFLKSDTGAAPDYSKDI